MTSDDLIILEAINGLEGKIVAIQSEIKDARQEIKDTRKDLMAEIRVNQGEIRAVHDKVNMGFTLMTVFLGIIGGLTLLIPTIKALGDFFASRKKDYATVEQVQELQRLIESSVANK